MDALNVFTMKSGAVVERIAYACRFYFFEKTMAGKYAAPDFAASGGKIYRKKPAGLWRILLCGIAMFTLTACHQERSASCLAPPGKFTGWSIHNTAAGDVLFSLTVNDKCWSNRQRIIDEISTHSSDKQEFVIKATEWVHRYSRNIRPLSTDNWIHSPEVFMNSLGLGYCDDRASVLVNLWRAYGLTARVWDLQGHVVPEVRVAGKWQLHDPDTGVFMLDDNLQICSVADVAAGRACYYQISQQRYPMNAVARTLLLIDKYTTADDNQLSDWYHASRLLPDSLFRLPPAASMHCCGPGPEDPHTYTLELRLPPGSRGKLSVPLVLAAFPAVLSGLIPKADSLYGEIQIANHQRDTLSLYYYVNPFVWAEKQHTKLLVRGRNADRLLVNWHELSQVYNPPRYLDDFRDYYLSSGILDEWIPKLPAAQNFGQLPEVFTHYCLLQGMSPQEVSLRQQAFLLGYRQLLPVMQEQPALERLFLQNPVYQILLFDLCQTLAPQELLPYLENLSL